MSEKQLIPNEVGRLDDVTDALRAGNDREALRLLDERAIALREWLDKLVKEFRTAKQRRQSILDFVDRYLADPEFRGQVRRECGWAEEIGGGM